MRARLLPLYFIVFILLFYSSSVVASSSETTIYLSSIEKNIESGEVRVYYVAGNGSIVRSTNRNGISTISYLHPDHLGSNVLITKPDKTRETSITYYPYGKETTILPSSKTDKLYTNQRKDISSNLYFYNARYYNPNTSHFISADRAEGPNRYSYVSNNPIMKNDPSGLMVPPDMDVYTANKNDYQKFNLRSYYFATVEKTKYENSILTYDALNGSNRSKLEVSEEDLNSVAWKKLERDISLTARKVNQQLDLYQNKTDLAYLDVITYSVNKNITYNPELLSAWNGKEYAKKTGDINLFHLAELSEEKAWRRYDSQSNLEDRIKEKTMVCFDIAAVESIYLGKRGIRTDLSSSSKLSHAWLEVNFN